MKVSSLLSLVNRVDLSIKNYCGESFVETLFRTGVGIRFIEFVATYAEKYNIDTSKFKKEIICNENNKQSPMLKLMNDIYNEQIKTNNIKLLEFFLPIMEKLVDPTNFKYSCYIP